MLPAVLDPVQLARIQGMHRGFLYQHVYAVLCLLRAPRTGVEHVRVERDEDIELVGHSGTLYAQIKSRSDPLTPSDLKGVTERFAELRAEHALGGRAGTPRFAIVSNVEHGPALLSHTWAPDISIVTPSSTLLPDDALLAPPPTVDGLLALALEAADGFRNSALRPESLVAKLIGLVAAASAGTGSHDVFLTAELPQFCELVAAQLRPLPVVSGYRPQSSEPVLPSDRGPLLVAGHSGDGKSAWAAQLATCSTEVAVYVPCSSTIGESLATRLVDAIVATLVTRGTVRAHELVLPGRSGLDALALLNTEISARDISILVVLDDCHHASATTIAATYKAAPWLRWVFLGHPSASVSELAAFLGAVPQSLGGWDDDVIAELLAERECPAGPTEVAALRRVTHGAPLFVLHAVRTIHDGDRDVAAYVRALNEGTTIGRPAQEVLLSRVVEDLPPDVARVTAALASVELSLSTKDWAAEVARALGLPEAAALRALRTAVELGVAYSTEAELISVHDGFRTLLAGRFVSADEIQLLRKGLATFLRTELLNHRAKERISAYVEILASLGRLSDLADLANAISEWIRETGTISVVRLQLEGALDRAALAPTDEFWALDSLAFFDVEEGRTNAAAARLPRMRELAATLDDEAKGAVLHKDAIVALRNGDLPRLRDAVAVCPPGHRYSRVIRYHGAVGESVAGNVKEAVMLLLGIAEEYLERIGLTPQMVLGKNPPELRKLMRDDADADDVRHLADCYNAIATVLLPDPDPERRKHGALFALWAMKFFDMAGAVRSVLRSGQDVVDMMLSVWGDARAARAFMEQSLLPAASQARLPDLTFQIRAQYAVVCAHCGEYAAADAELARLAPYISGLPPAGQREIANQSSLIDKLRERGVPTVPSAAAARATAERVRRLRYLQALRELPDGINVDPSEPCPCGSGASHGGCCGESA